MFERIVFPQDTPNQSTPHQAPQGLVVYQSTLLKQAGVFHGFSTRQAGRQAGTGHNQSVHGLATPEWDLATVRQPDTRKLSQGYEHLLQAIGCPSYPLVYVQQVHGNSVLLVDAQDAYPGAGNERKQDALPPSADGLVTAESGLALAIRIADCVPVLMTAVVQGQPMAVAAVHAGWRGLVAGIIPEALRTVHLQVKQLIASPNASQTHDKPVDVRIICAIGPCISAKHFEVGHEVADAFADANLDVAILYKPGQKPHIDLPLAAKLQMLASGVAADDIDPGVLCTFEQEEDFFSHRRDHGQTGRLAAVIALQTR